MQLAPVFYTPAVTSTEAPSSPGGASKASACQCSCTCNQADSANTHTSGDVFEPGTSHPQTKNPSEPTSAELEADWGKDSFDSIIPDKGTHPHIQNAERGDHRPEPPTNNISPRSLTASPALQELITTLTQDPELMAELQQLMTDGNNPLKLISGLNQLVRKRPKLKNQLMTLANDPDVRALLANPGQLLANPGQLMSLIRG